MSLPASTGFLVHVFWNEVGHGQFDRAAYSPLDFFSGGYGLVEFAEHVFVAASEAGKVVEEGSIQVK